MLPILPAGLPRWQGATRGRPLAGTNTHQWTCDGSNAANLWLADELEETPGEAFQLVNEAAGTCLNVEGGSSEPGTNTHQTTCYAENPANVWYWVGTGEWRQLKNMMAQTCLNVEGGSCELNTNAHQTTCYAENPANLWKWVGTGSYRQLVNQAAGTCLNVEGGSSEPGTNTHQWTCDSSNTANLWFVDLL